MGLDEFIIQRRKEIFLVNELVKLQQEYKKLRNFALIDNKDNKSYIKHLEMEFNNCLENIIDNVAG